MSPAPHLILGALAVIAASTVALALFLAAARAGRRSEDDQ